MKNVNFFNLGAKSTANSGGGNSRVTNHFWRYFASFILLFTLALGNAWGTMVSLYDGTANVTVGFQNAEYQESNWTGKAAGTENTYKKNAANPTFKAMSIRSQMGFRKTDAGKSGLQLGNGNNQGGALCFYVSAKCEFRIVASTNANNQTIYLYKDASEYSLTSSNYATAGTEVSSHTYAVKQTAEAFTGVLESGYYRIASGVNKIWIDTIKLTTYVPVTGISITPSSANVTVGRQVQLSATASPTTASLKSVTWSVKSGGTYASVNSKTGVVRGLAAGDAVITATANDGSGVTQDINVSVAEIDCDTYSGNLFQMEVLKVCTCTIASGKTFALTDGDNYSVYGGAIALNNKGGSQKVVMSKVQSSLIQWNFSTADVGFDVTLADCNFKKGDIITITSTESNELYLNDGSAKGASTDATTSSLSYTVQEGDKFIGKNRIVIWKGASNTFVRAITITRPVTAYTLSASATPDGYGTLTASSIANITSGTAISTSSNVLTVGESSITANPTAQTAQYTYAFSSWLKSDDSALPSTVTADLNVKAVFTRTARTYEVTLHANDGTINEGDVTSYTFGVGATLPTNVTKASCDFAGWYTDNGVWSDGPYTTIANDATGNKEYWAKWTAEAPKHSITYTNLKGSDVSAYPTQYAQGTGIASFHALNDVEGWHFTGWSPSSISSSATTDQVIEAQWVPIYNVSFNSNGGSAVAAQHIVSGEAATAPDPAPTRTNWTFLKWQLNGVDYNFSTPVSDNITLDAVWSRNSISGAESQVVLVSTSAAIGSTSPLTDVYYGNAVWTYTGNAKISTGGAMFGTPDSKKWVGFTLPAGYTATVTANSTNSNERHCVLVTETERAGAAGDATFLLDITTNSSTTTKTSSSFGPGAYALGSTSGGIDINSVVVNITADPLKATFMNGETKEFEITVTSGEALGNLFLSGELPTLVKAGYEFNGWFTAPTAGTQVTKATTITASTTYYAQWTAGTYDITLVSNNANADGSAKATMGAAALSDITAPVAEGSNILKGYYTTSDNDVKVADASGNFIAGVAGYTDANGKWDCASNISLHAQWSTPVDVRFFNGEDQVGATQSIAIGNTAVAPADPTKSGYHFMGWSTDLTEANIKDVATYVITAATDFNAIFRQEFTVTYYDGDDALDSEIVLSGESPVKDLTALEDERPFRTFVAWYSDNTLETEIADVAALTITANTPIYGSWTKNYASSIDMVAMIDEDVSTDDILTALSTRNYVLSSTTNVTRDANANEYDRGLKIKKNGTILSFLVEADKLVLFKTGSISGATLSVNGGSAEDLTLAKTTKTRAYYSASEQTFVFTTTTAEYNILKSITIIDPYVVTYDATTNGGSCGTASAKYHAEALTLPAATKSDASFLGWYDAATGGTKIGEAGAEYTPSGDITLYAHFLNNADVADLTDIKLDGVSIEGFDRDILTYNKEYAYAAPAPAITFTKQIEGSTAVPSAVTMPGIATITVTSTSGNVTKVYTLNFTYGPKDGVSIIKAALSGQSGKTATVTMSGLIGGTCANALSKMKSDGGAKLDADTYIGLTLAEGTFREGDVVNVHVTTAAGQGTFAVWADAACTELIKDAETMGSAGDNKMILPAAVNGKSTIYLARVDAVNNWNPQLNIFEVLRPMNPVVTEFALDGTAGVVDETNKRITVSLPVGTTLTENADPTSLTIVSNTAQASVTKEITTNGGEWRYGDNNYSVTDKDGDYTDYTVRIYQQTRTGLVAEKMSTSCYPRAISMYRGVTFYELAGGYGAQGSPTMLLFLEAETLEAGKPYLYVPTDNDVPLEVAFTGDAVSEQNYRGFYGNFAGIPAAPDNILVNNYIIYNNIVQCCGENCYIGANRAYFKIEEVPCYSTKEDCYAAAEAARSASPAPGMRLRRMAVSNGAHGTPTALDNISEDGVTGIRRGCYDVLGRKIAEPVQGGFYILNGKKIIK